MLAIYKTFVRSHLDFADIIYNKPFNDSFKEKLEKFQYSAAPIITGAIKGTSLERLYQELGLKSLSKRSRPSYLQSYFLLDNEGTYNTRSNLRNMIKTVVT